MAKGTEKTIVTKKEEAMVEENVEVKVEEKPVEKKAVVANRKVKASVVGYEYSGGGVVLYFDNGDRVKIKKARVF